MNSDRAKRRTTKIATRAMMAAQMAVAVRAQAKKVLKEERRKGQGVPIYYVQNIVTLISRVVDTAGQCSAATLAVLEHRNLTEDSPSGSKEALHAADAMSRSAAYQALSAKTLYEALLAMLAARESSVSSAYEADSE